MGPFVDGPKAPVHQPCVSNFHPAISPDGLRLKTDIHYTHSTEEEIISVYAATAQDVDKAVRAARAAFEGDEWQSVVGTARGKLMLKVADLVESQQHVLATIEALDNGKPYSQALGDIEEVFSVFRYYGGWADKTYGQTIETGRHKFTYTVREPIGVCGQIIP